MKRTDREQKAFDYWKKNPIEAAKDWFKIVPDDAQAAIINDTFIGNEDRTAIKSSHGVGKTTTLAICGWMFLNFYPMCRVVATAPTFPQLHDILWPEYAKWHLNMPDMVASQWEISGNHIRHKDDGHHKLSQAWFAVSRTSNRAENLQGFHGTDLMIQGDEASGIPPDVFEVIEGALSEAGEIGKTAKLLLAGNPNFNAGEFYNAFGRNKELYNRYTISGDPKIFDILKLEKGGDYHKDHGRVFYSKRVSKRYFDTMATKYGLDSGIFDVRVRGLFPREEKDTVIPLEWVQRAVTRPSDKFDKITNPVRLVMDVGRGGSGETVLSSFRVNTEIKKQAWGKTTTPQCVDHLIDEMKYWKALGLRVDQVIIDEPGVGGGVVDEARRSGLPVTPYHGGESLKRGQDPEDEIRMFANRRARDWWRARRMFETNNITLIDDDLTVKQLASVHFFYNERDRIQVESKQKMRDRLGDDSSPDRADTIVMGIAPWYSFNSPNVMVSMNDVFFGDDRPTADLDLF